MPANENAEGDVAMEGVSPSDKTSMQQTISRSLGAMRSRLDVRSDPDAQTTVTDFLDFTEYLPSDMVRSLTLIGKLDEDYQSASTKVDRLTTTWGQLPTLAAAERPSPAKLREEISHQLHRAVNTRTYAYAESKRMSENLHRHYNKAAVLLEKLQLMMDNYPKDDPKSPAMVKSPQLSRAKLAGRSGADGTGPRTRKQRMPKVTVPGEVLAPYDIEYDTFSGDSDISSDEESEIMAANTRTPATAPRIKLVSAGGRTPKSANRVARSKPVPPALSAANAAALLQPPPENAVIGSTDAPWLQLTEYELAKLRKRMKKNAVWTPSETMVARELKNLRRGPDAYRDAKRKAEQEGQAFEPVVPSTVVDDESGSLQLPAGAMSVEALATEHVPTSNRGMKLNEAKKLKRETMAKLAAEEAEEQERKMREQAKTFLGSGKGASNVSASDTSSKNGKSRATSRSGGKRKWNADGDASGDGKEGSETPTAAGPQLKRQKTETPVPPPQHPSMARNTQAATSQSTHLTPSGNAKSSHTTQQTPVPIPIPHQGSSRSAISPTPSSTVTTTVPVKPPGVETPVPLPGSDRPQSVTPMSAGSRDASGRGSSKRETRGDTAKVKRGKATDTVEGTDGQDGQSAPQPATGSSSQGATPRTTPVPEGAAPRRPASQGKGMGQEPQPSLAADRPRRASAAPIAPGPGIGLVPGPSMPAADQRQQQAGRRTKRPVPGIVRTTNSGGNSAVGKRSAAPVRVRKKKGQTEVETEEVDDEGNPISPDEPRFCSCIGVSYGTMIECENSECKFEWFHLKCVGLEAVPARTTKWYCPDCRKVLNIGEKGEVSARGVKR